MAEGPSVDKNLALPRASTTPAIASVGSTPAPLRAATIPAASVASDAGSGTSNDTLQDGQHIQRSPAAGSPLATNSSSQPPREPRAESSAIDPLSQHILQRTNTQKSIPLRLLGRASYEAEAGSSEYTVSEQGPIRGDAVPSSKSAKEKKKGVSFLSRIIGTKKKEQLSDAEDDSPEPETSRMSADTPIGFIPRHPRPARYLRVKAHYKKGKTFSHVFLAQELEGADAQPGAAERRISIASTAQIGENTGKAVWALEFSKDGKYLAAAGQDRKVRVWAVIASTEQREAADQEEDRTPIEAHDPPRLKAPVFQSKPIQVYEGHAGSILDLSWSKNNFLLSSSMDKTVRLWHVSRPECLCCFRHSDFVTSVQFHPRDDRFFLAGSLDTKLRLWSIPDKSVAFATAVPDMITAVAFTPDGRHAMAGCLHGLLSIYDTEGLKTSAQLHVRSARGRNAKGSKITGIDAMVVPPDNANGDVKLLVTSNDSRIRLYNFGDRSLEAKFHGNENTCSQIRASFTDDGKHIICGSEDRRAYVWPVGAVERAGDKRAVEVLETHSAMVTAAIMAPTRTKQLLGLSEDPIYDICNPPPVSLMSPEQPADASKQEISTKENGHDHARSASASRLSIISKMAQESPTFLSRSTHPDGNILIIAEYSGKIKVLRQDCAYKKRRFENWDPNSLSRRILRRPSSARHSIASSMGKDSTHKTPSERIISWRNSVIRHGRTSTEGSHSGHRSRSPSPRHPPTLRLPASRPSSLAPNESLSMSTTSPPLSPRRPRLNSVVSSENAGRTNGDRPSAQGDARRPQAALPEPVTGAKGKSSDNPLWLQGDRSYAYWGRITHDTLAARSRKSNDLLQPNHIPSSSLDRKLSRTGSVLSSDYGSSSRGGSGEEDDVLKCENCRGTNFRGVKGRDGKQKLICVQCHRPVT